MFSGVTNNYKLKIEAILKILPNKSGVKSREWFAKNWANWNNNNNTSKAHFHRIIIYIFIDKMWFRSK